MSMRDTAASNNNNSIVDSSGNSRAPRNATSSTTAPYGLSSDRVDALRKAPDPFVLSTRGSKKNSSSSRNRIATWYSEMVTSVRERRDRQTGPSAPPMPLSFYHRTLKAHRHTRSTYCQLFLFVPFLLAFVFLFYADRDIEGDYYTASAIRTTLLDASLPPVDLSSITNSTTTESVAASDRNPYSRWSYFDNGQEFPDGYDTVKQLLLPILFPSDAERRASFNITAQQLQNASLVPFPDRIRSLFLGSVQSIGPVRIRTKHVRPNTCDSIDTTLYSDRSDAIEFFKANCFSSWSSDDESEDWSMFSSASTLLPWTPFSQSGCDMSVTSTFVTLFGLIKHYSCGGFYVDMPLGSTSLEGARAIADTMNSERFQHGRHARLIQVSLFLYRGAGDVLLHVNLYTEVTIGGGWSVRADVSPFRLALINGGWMAYAVVVLIFFLMFTILYVTRASVHYATRGTFLWTFFLQPWNVVELVNMIAFYVWFGFYCAWWARSQDEAYRVDDIDGRDSGEDNYPQGLVEIHALYWIMSYLNALNVLFLFLKLLKFLRLNARINVLERTLIAAARSLLSVVAVLCLFVLAYSITGMILYGGFLFDYRNLAASWATTFRVLIGVFDYAALNQVYRAATFIYFWTFVVFGVFALLNFCIAILMKHFEEQYNQAQLPPVVLSMRLGFESFLFYTARTGGWTMVKDFVTFKSREWNRGASLLADRCATRKLLQRIRQREAEQELLKKMGPIAMAKAREVQHRSSVDPVPPEETPGTSQRDAATLNDTRSSATSGLDASGFMGSVTSARLAGLLDDDNDDGDDQTQQQTQQSFRASFAAGAAGCVEISSPTFVADDEIVLGRSATRNRRVARFVPPLIPDHQIHRSTSPTPQPPSTRPVPRNNTAAPVGSIRRKKTDPVTVDKGTSRAAAALEATVVAVKKKIRDQDVIRDDLSLLYQQAASSPESLFISYSDMFLEQRNVKKRNGEARKELDALKNTKHELLSQLEQVRVVATSPSSPSASSSHTAPVMAHIVLAQQLDQVEESIAVLQHEIHLLDVMLAVPTSDLETIWCRLYDEFEGTSTAQRIRAAQGRTRAVQESVTKAVSSALMPLRRRLFDPDYLAGGAGGRRSGGENKISNNNIAALPSAALPAPNNTVVATTISGFHNNNSNNNGLGTSSTNRRKGATTFLEDAPSFLETTALEATRQESSIIDSTTSSPQSTSKAASSAGGLAAAAAATARRRRAGSMIAAHVLPASTISSPPLHDDDGEEDEPLPSALVLTSNNNGLAVSFQHALADMETYLGAVTALLDNTLEPLRWQ